MKYLVFLLLAITASYGFIQGQQGHQSAIANCDNSVDGFTLFEGNCWNAADLQACSLKLGDLDHLVANSYQYNGETVNYVGMIYNTCEVRDGDQKIYDFEIVVDSDFDLDLDCFSHEVFFVNYADDTTEIKDQLAVGSGSWVNTSRDEYFLDQGAQSIKFTIDHEDLVSQYGCDYEETATDYIWYCKIQYDLRLSGQDQYTYIFTMQVTLPRQTDATLNVTVERNVVQGECCENELSIASSLHFCGELDCSNGYINLSTYTRRQHFFVAHVIDTPEFQQYQLQGLSIKLGPFLPKIHAQGRYVVGGAGAYNYELESFAAFTSLTIESVAKIDDPSFTGGDNADNFQDVQGARRALQEGKNQFFKAQEQISIKDQEESSDDNDDKEDNATVLSFGLVFLIALFLL